MVPGGISRFLFGVVHRCSPKDNKTTDLASPSQSQWLTCLIGLAALRLAAPTWIFILWTVAGIALCVRLVSGGAACPATIVGILKNPPHIQVFCSVCDGQRQRPRETFIES